MIEEELESKLEKKVRVKGCLIGTKPTEATRSIDKRRLLKKISEFGTNSKIRVMDTLELITISNTIHQHGIEVFEAEESRLNKELG